MNIFEKAQFIYDNSSLCGMKTPLEIIDFYSVDKIDNMIAEIKSWNKYTDELCPHCNNEVQILINGISICPECGEKILPCSMCDMNSVNCNYCKWEN